mmetsp:Transcript_14436/g.36804  ORF Transcript_14436/g.36804 Transcript_14436/m.36804 type:complete len:204 (-) Transcript_14436:524-1135(-)
MEPKFSLSGPEIVPVPSKSPGCMLHPVTVWWTSCCLRVQYMYLRLELHTTNASSLAFGLIATDRLISYAESFESLRYSRGAGSCLGWGHLKGSRASKVTIQGEIVVQKFLAPKGPRGTYSHFWISRALQSFMSTTPKILSSASSMEMGSPCLLPVPTKKPISSSKSRSLQGVYLGASSVSALVWPEGRGKLWPDTTTEEARPW